MGESHNFLGPIYLDGGFWFAQYDVVREPLAVYNTHLIINIYTLDRYGLAHRIADNGDDDFAGQEIFELEAGLYLIIAESTNNEISEFSLTLQ